MNHPPPIANLISEYPQPPPIQTPKWFQNVPPHQISMSESSFRPTVYPTQRTTINNWPPTRNITTGTDNTSSYNSDSVTISSSSIAEPQEKELSRSDLNRLSILDLVGNHMKNLIALYSENNNLSNFIDPIKLSGTHNIYDAIDKICTQTLQLITQLRNEELEKNQQTDLELKAAVNDLMYFLLKKDNREDILINKDINRLFIDWVNLQKTDRKGDT